MTDIPDIDAAFRDFLGDFPETYPGSNTKREIPEPDPGPALNEWDADPKVMLLNGEETEFFTIGAMALALNRKPVAIRKWEREGYIPTAPYREPGKRGNRLYTRPYIEGLQAIVREEGLLDPARHVVIKDTNLTERAIRLWEALKEVGA